MHLARFPRLRFAHLPTPIEPLENLTRELGGPEIWIKRDDCTGLGFGGNKTRKLEFLMADALEQGADTVITQGAVQSNHARQTAAAARKLDLACELVFEARVQDPTEDYNRSGNVFLDHLFQARMRTVPAGSDMNAAMEEVAVEVRGQGGTPYVIPGGGSNRVGALGYADCALELMTQANDMDLTIDHVVHATGSAGTQAGLVAGLRALNSGIPVYGVGVNAPEAVQHERVLKLAQETADYLGAPGVVEAEHVQVTDRYVGQGYGIPTEGMVEAVSMLARLEGILLDPVYSGKGMAGLIDRIRQGEYGTDETVLFIHTGGAPGLYAYMDSFVPAA